MKQLRRNLSILKNNNTKTKNSEKKIRKAEAKLRKTLEEIDRIENDPSYKPKEWTKAKNNYGFGEYHTYINSIEWAFRKSEYYKSHSRVCRTCGVRDKEIHLHHRTYARVYKEDDADLMPLCLDCHAALHHLQGRFSLSVEDATKLWFDATNSVPDKKKIREALRESDFAYFKFICDVNLKAHKDPEDLLRAATKKISKGGYRPKDHLIKDPEKLKIEICYVKRTGYSTKYDRKVDDLIRVLEKQR